MSEHHELSERPYRFTDDEIDEWATPPTNLIWESGKDWNTYCLAHEVRALRRELRERRDAEHACGRRCQTCLDAERAVTPSLILLLDVWQALGLHPNDFHGWVDGAKVTVADAWAQLLGAIAGRSDSLASDTNPPAPSALVQVAIEREVDAVAPAQVDDTPNPYRYHITVRPLPRGGWVVRGGWHDLQVITAHDTEAEARHHAALIASALREVTVDEG